MFLDELECCFNEVCVLCDCLGVVNLCVDEEVEELVKIVEEMVKECDDLLEVIS